MRRTDESPSHVSQVNDLARLMEHSRIRWRIEGSPGVNLGQLRISRSEQQQQGMISY